MNRGTTLHDQCGSYVVGHRTHPFPLAKAAQDMSTSWRAPRGALEREFWELRVGRGCSSNYREMTTKRDRKTADLISLLSQFWRCEEQCCMLGWNGAQPQQFPYDGNLFADYVAGKLTANGCRLLGLVWLLVSLGELWMQDLIPLQFIIRKGWRIVSNSKI